MANHHDHKGPGSWLQAQKEFMQDKHIQYTLYVNVVKYHFITVTVHNKQNS